MSVGDQRCETRMADQASRLLKRRGLWTIGAGATKRPYQLSGRAYVVWYEHGGLMTANCLWRTGESRGMSCARLPHQVRQTRFATVTCNGGCTEHAYGSKIVWCEGSRMLPAALIISLRDSRLSAQPWMACRPLGTINSLHHPVAIVASII